MQVTSGVFQKSAQGTQALATRDPALTPKLRSMLILVDGKRKFEELAKLGGMLGEPAQLLEQLAALGMIEQVAGTVPSGAPAAVSSGATPLGPAAAPVSLAEAQRYAVRRLTDLMGPTAEDLCMRIEATRNAAEFQAVLKRAEGLLRDFGGAEMARAFGKDMASRLPA